MKIPVQEKIAELERRIVVLEAAARTRHQTTTTTTTAPLTPVQQGHLDSLWSHFEQVFVHMGKVFR